MKLKTILLALLVSGLTFSAMAEVCVMSVVAESGSLGYVEGSCGASEQSYKYNSAVSFLRAKDLAKVTSDFEEKMSAKFSSCGSPLVNTQGRYSIFCYFTK